MKVIPAIAAKFLLAAVSVSQTSQDLRADSVRCAR
jgi:hypothetical protein